MLGTYTLTVSNSVDNFLNTRIDRTGTLKNGAALMVDGLVLDGGVLFDNTGSASLDSASMEIGETATAVAILNAGGSYQRV
jgi:hypothetical protein